MSLTGLFICIIASALLGGVLGYLFGVSKDNPVVEQRDELD